MQETASTPIPVFMSRGVSGFVAMVFQELPALRLKVSGRLHARHIIIALNGSDYYEVYPLKEDDSNTKCADEGVCFDKLDDVIGRAIKSGTDKGECDKFCNRQLAELLSGTRA